MIFIGMGIKEMVERIQCPHCELHLAGQGFLQRHIQSVHKLELIEVKVKENSSL